MNREIKFRVWDQEKNKIIGYEIINSNHNNGFSWWYADDEEELLHSDCSNPGMLKPSGFRQLLREQFTGLKDKNGKEIYEGDIIKAVTEYYGTFTVPIIFYNGYFATNNYKAVQIENPKRWDKKHDCVDSYGFITPAYAQLMDGYSSVSSYITDEEGKNKTIYDLEVIGNIHEGITNETT